MVVYFDITDVLEYARGHATLSGIPRTTLAMVSHLVTAHGPDRLRLIAYHPVRRRIETYDASCLAGGWRYDQAAFCRQFGLRPRSPQPTSEGPSRRWAAAVRDATVGLAETADRLSALAPSIRPSGAPPLGPAPKFERGDVIFIPGATWGWPQYLDALARFRLDPGIKLVQFIHDLIPVMTPEYVVGGVPAVFSRWLDELGRHADLFIANSEATSADLSAWLDARGRNTAIEVVRLAHQFGSSNRAEALASVLVKVPGPDISERVRLAASTPFVLSVGTLEPRKNHIALLHAWQNLAAQLGFAMPRLILVGNAGWKRERFDALLADTQAVDGLVTVFESLSDAELAWLYRHCLFSVYISLKEGWGLPIGEALWYGRPVVASNVSAMPEVAGPLVDYADPTSPISIEMALRGLILDQPRREARAAEIAAAELRTWDQVADDLWFRLTGSQTFSASAAG